MSTLQTNRGSGLTLVELLVVVGIVGLLIGLLLPVLYGVRHRALSVRCSANLAGIGSLVRAVAADAHGCVPVAGRVIVGDLSMSNRLSQAIGDSARRQNLYVSSPVVPGAEEIAPTQAVLAAYQTTSRLPKVGLLTISALDAFPKQMELLRCPANAERASSDMALVVTVVGTGQYASGWGFSSDYIFNEWICGRNMIGKGWPNGKIDRARSPSTLVLATDASTLVNGSGWWQVSESDSTPLAISSFLSTDPNTDVRLFDRKRHRGKLNVLFADGHVEALDISQPALSRAMLRTASQ